MDKNNRFFEFLRKHWSNLLILIVIVLLTVPQVRLPVQVFLNSVISFSPSKIESYQQKRLKDYHWSLQDMEGSYKNLDDAKGKVTVINFWATWCAPCIAEMDDFQQLYNDYQKQVAFYFVSNQEVEKISNFLKEKELDLPVYQPLDKVPELLQGNVLPTTYIISAEGDIIVRKEGTAKWNSDKTRKILDELLK